MFHIQSTISPWDSVDFRTAISVMIISGILPCVSNCNTPASIRVFHCGPDSVSPHSVIFTAAISFIRPFWSLDDLIPYRLEFLGYNNFPFVVCPYGLFCSNSIWNDSFNFAFNPIGIQVTSVSLARAFQLHSFGL